MMDGLQGKGYLRTDEVFEMYKMEKVTFGLTNSWHGDHEEVDTVPVRQLDSICEIWRVTAVFEL